MPTYAVTFPVTINVDVIVDADTQEEAKIIAKDHGVPDYLIKDFIDQEAQVVGDEPIHVQEVGP